MPKRIVVCSDGTWNTPDRPSPTNVVKMARAVLPTASDGTAQEVFYDWGVGTERGLDRILGGAFGEGLLKNVEDGYRYIVHNYEPGDHVFLFGFSRGAYTARSIAGLVRKCGLLDKRHADLISDAIALYKNPQHPDDDRPKNFRKEHSREIGVYFIGVWDTVGALGIPLRWFDSFTRSRYQFHDVELSGIVQNAYQALAIDEKRYPFRPSVWAPINKPGQTVEQVWFAGSHSDVGGGYGETGLSDVALRWMADKAVTCGLELDQSFLNDISHPDPLGPLHDSSAGLFRLMRPYIRPIDNSGQNESLSPSALERFNSAAMAYEPANLKRFVGKLKGGAS